MWANWHVNIASATSMAGESPLFALLNHLWGWSRSSRRYRANKAQTRGANWRARLAPKEMPMNTAATPFVECEQVHAGLAVTDIAAAIDFYTKKLGFKLAFTWGDPPTFAGVNLDKVQMFLRKGTPDPQEHLHLVFSRRRCRPALRVPSGQRRHNRGTNRR